MFVPKAKEMRESRYICEPPKHFFLPPPHSSKSGYLVNTSGKSWRLGQLNDLVTPKPNCVYILEGAE